MSALDIVLLGITAAALAMGPPYALKLWRDELRFPRDPLRVLGPRGWRAWSRALPLASVAVPLAALLAVPAAIAGHGQRPVWAQIPLILAATSFFGAVATGVAISLFNRPRVLVPPHRRNEVGLIGELRTGLPPQPVAQQLWHYDQPDVPTAAARPTNAVVTYRDWRQALVATAMCIFFAISGAAVSLSLFGRVAGAVVGAGLVFIFAYAIYRVLATSVTVGPQSVVIMNLGELVTLSWDEIDRFEIVKGDGPGLLVRARLKDGDGLRLLALESPQLRLRSHDKWARDAVASLNAQLDEYR